ncbi:MAG TPA: hypothetical protein VIM86_00250, partial [Thermodesulfobacteriota bacterium]
MTRQVLGALLAAVVLAGCASFGDAGLISTLRGTVTLDRTSTPAVVYLEDPKEGRWRLEGPMVSDLRELDRAVVEVHGLGDPRLPRGEREPGTFALHAYRLIEVGGRPALVGRLAWEGPDLILVQLDRDDQRVALAGPMLPSLTSLMGKSIWIAGVPRQGVFVVERYGVLRQ